MMKCLRCFLYADEKETPRIICVPSNIKPGEFVSAVERKVDRKKFQGSDSVIKLIEEDNRDIVPEVFWPLEYPVTCMRAIEVRL